MTPVLLAAVTGLVQGARHALEPDHVTAVATVMVKAPSPRRGMFYAGCWGLGHASMLCAVAGPLVLLRVELPGLLSTILELAVGAMLVYLGVRTLREAEHGHEHPLGQRSAATEHPLGQQSAATEHASLPRRGFRPFAIGLMHGLAGSGALAALIAIASPTASVGLACLGLYALGTVFGMVALAAVAGPVLARAGRLPKVASGLARVAGIASIGVGIVWAVKTLIAA